MGIETEIAWTDSTWNPIWGCTKVDPACAHCYAETFDRRVGGGARKMELEWAREQRDQAREAGAAFFTKQIGGHPHKLDQMTDFPLDLQIREFPTPRVLEAFVPRETQAALF